MHRLRVISRKRETVRVGDVFQTVTVVNVTTSKKTRALVIYHGGLDVKEKILAAVSTIHGLNQQALDEYSEGEISFDVLMGNLRENANALKMAVSMQGVADATSSPAPA